MLRYNMMKKSLRCVSMKVRKLPHYYGLNYVNIFLDEFEREVPEEHYFQRLELALHSTLTYWWGMHKESFAEWKEYNQVMKLMFGYVSTQITDKYSGRDDPWEHLAWQTKDWEEKPQPEWVHIFCHTLDIILMNWYLEIEPCYGTLEWDILRDTFLLTFIFEDGYECINEALQEIKAAIFRMPEELVEWVELDQSTQLCHTLECYNVTSEEE